MNSESLAQLVKNLPAMQETLIWFLAREICWRRDRVPTPVFLGFPVVQLVKNLPAKKKRICLQWGSPGFDPCVGKIPWRRERLPTPIFWPGEFHGLYSPWGHKESDTTERLSLSLFPSVQNSSNTCSLTHRFRKLTWLPGGRDSEGLWEGHVHTAIFKMGN